MLINARYALSHPLLDYPPNLEKDVKKGNANPFMIFTAQLLNLATISFNLQNKDILYPTLIFTVMYIYPRVKFTTLLICL